MAIYDTGTASLSASGQVAGVGTQWTMPLTLIRVGATIIFKTEPVQIYTISEITSDTSLSVHNPNGETVPSGTGYAILAHDGITVQGLAQYVAETLRYYQSNNYVTADENGNVEIHNGGTGASSAPDARANLGLGSAATFDTVPVANGGTGASSAPDARANLGLGSAATFDTVPVANGGTGASSAAGARINIGALSNTPAANTGTGGTGARVQHATGSGLFSLDMFNCYWYMQPEDTNFWVAHAVSYAGGGGEASGYGRVIYAIKIADGTTKYVHCLTNKNTITDTGGFIKAASPVVNIYANGQYETNDESEGASVIRQGIGEYLITGCLGLNSDAKWGGVDGGFEIPTDRNKQPRVWLDYEVKEDGSILVKTYHRTHPTSPVFARNEIAGFADGDPIDIPSDAFISVRVEMPTE